MNETYLYRGNEYTYDYIYNRAIERGFDSAEAYLAEYPEITKKEKDPPKTNLELEDKKNQTDIY